MVTISTFGQQSGWFYENCRSVTAGGLKVYGLPDPAVSTSPYGPLPLFQIDGEQTQFAASTSRTYRAFSCSGWENIILYNPDAVNTIWASGGVTTTTFPEITKLNGFMYVIGSTAVTGVQSVGPESDTSSNGSKYYSLEVDDLSSGSSWVCNLMGSNSGSVGVGGVTLLSAESSATSSYGVTTSSTPIAAGYCYINVTTLTGGPIKIIAKGTP
jgi:hypothetical protein